MIKELFQTLDKVETLISASGVREREEFFDFTYTFYPEDIVPDLLEKDGEFVRPNLHLLGYTLVRKGQEFDQGAIVIWLHTNETDGKGLLIMRGAQYKALPDAVKPHVLEHFIPLIGDDDIYVWTLVSNLDGPQIEDDEYGIATADPDLGMRWVLTDLSVLELLY